MVEEGATIEIDVGMPSTPNRVFRTSFAPVTPTNSEVLRGRAGAESLESSFGNVAVLNVLVSNILDSSFPLTTSAVPVLNRRMDGRD